MIMQVQNVLVFNNGVEEDEWAKEKVTQRW